MCGGSRMRGWRQTARILGLTCVLALCLATRHSPGSTFAPVQLGRSLVLAEVLEEPAVKEQVAAIRGVGAAVYPAIGQLFQEKGETYELTLFLFVKDAGYFYRGWYLKLGPKATPVLVLALPGGLKELGLEKLVTR